MVHFVFVVVVVQSLSYNDDETSSDFTILYRVSQEECARLQEGVPYVKVY